MPDYTYDEVPYPPMAFAFTHPNRLATIGKLLGMQPAPPSHCRVLELGCATGTNLLPMAHAMPESEFFGVDLSAGHIEVANQRREALGLENITMLAMDLRDLPADVGQFDYIITHGIYSWVPPEVRAHIMRISQEHLAPEGIAYISYNTYPGWHMIEMARDIMRYYTRDIHKPYKRAEAGRFILEFMASAMEHHAPYYYGVVYRGYQHFLERQANNMPTNKDSVMLHDVLAETNQPFYFQEIIETAADFDLQFLSEADNIFTPGNHEEIVYEKINEWADHVLETEQYMDYVRNTTFRRTLFCHADVQLERQVSPERFIQNMYFTSFAQALQVPDEEREKGTEAFGIGSGEQFATRHALTIAAFNYLIGTAPRLVTFNELVEAVTPLLDSPPTQDDIDLLAASLLQAFSFSGQLIEPSMFAPNFTTTVSEYPAVSSLILMYAREGRRVINMRHEMHDLSDFDYMMISYVDGTRDVTALINMALELYREGKIELEYLGRPVTTPQLAREILEEEIPGMLNRFAYQAFLVE